MTGKCPLGLFIDRGTRFKDFEGVFHKSVPKQDKNIKNR